MPSRRGVHAMIHVSSPIVTPPLGEVMSRARSTADGESEDKYHDLSATIEGSREEIVVLIEPTRVVFPQVKLRDEGDSKPGRLGGIDPYIEPSDVEATFVIARVSDGTTIGEEVRDSHQIIAALTVSNLRPGHFLWASQKGTGATNPNRYAIGIILGERQIRKVFLVKQRSWISF